MTDITPENVARMLECVTSGPWQYDPDARCVYVSDGLSEPTIAVLERAEQDVSAALLAVCRKDPMPSVGRVEFAIKAAIRAMIPEVKP